MPAPGTAHRLPVIRHLPCIWQSQLSGNWWAASTTTVGAAFRDASPLLLQLFFFVTVLASYIYPLSYMSLGRLAMKRSPWLAISGIACGFIGSVIWGFLTDEFFWINMLAQLGLDAQFPRFQHAYLTNGWVYIVHTGWVIGHLLGYMLLGIVLLRARAIPNWAAWLIIVSVPIMGPLSYGTGLGLLQVLGYAMVFVGSIPAALASDGHTIICIILLLSLFMIFYSIGGKYPTRVSRSGPQTWNIAKSLEHCVVS